MESTFLTDFVLLYNYKHHMAGLKSTFLAVVNFIVYICTH